VAFASHDETARHEAARRFLAGRIDYERMLSMPCSEAAMKLERMRELLRLLGNPHERLPIVHVAGTKGKGSVSAMTAAMLSAAGYRTGLFTSPHLERVEERICIDGRPCPPDDWTELIERVRPAVEALDRANKGPTYFEILTAMALCYFFRQRADLAVLEVGLGGRLDATNVCTPRVTVIASISFDHTKQLGETLAAIAEEKAGIIKPGVPVVSGATAEEPRRVIRAIARQRGCRLVESGVDFDYAYHPPRHLEQAPAPGRMDFYIDCQDRRGRSAFDKDSTNSRGLTAPGNDATVLKDVAVSLIGRHQAANAAMALATIEELRRAGWNIPEAAVRCGLAEAVWPARVEVVSRRPAVVIDSAHNAASIAALLETLDESFSIQRRGLIFAATLEKDLRGMLEQLAGRFDRIVFTQYRENPRGVPPASLLALAEELQGRCAADAAPSPTELSIAADPREAWAAMRAWAKPDDLIAVAGSIFLAAEFRRILLSTSC